MLLLVVDAWSKCTMVVEWFDASVQCVLEECLWMCLDVFGCGLMQAKREGNGRVCTADL